MENAEIDETNIPVEITELKDTESAENFQKFIHKLFENNGVLNDLRAYLRGHIVDVLQKAETGESTSCWKNFTQRLELTFQAINILFAEYLLRLEFKYTLSVFTSEIPLSNMVFKFAKALLKSTDTDLSGLRFGESDIWSILNYLGVKCDSEHASKIVEAYKNQRDSPLLWCILKCIPMYQKPMFSEQVHSSEDSQSCSAKSEDSLENIAEKNVQIDVTNKCKHFMFCKSCQSRASRLKEKYKKKKNKLDENPKRMEVNKLNVDTFMQNVDILEQSMIDEMFNQLKTVYETEVDMIRDEKEKKIKRSIVNHALQLKKYREELEESFSARRSELTQHTQRRQRFLCELAKRLSQVQQNLVQEEQKLKTQMQEAEKSLKEKSEEMRSQISDELMLLQTNLETIKKERDEIKKEKVELENLKQIYNNNILKEKNSKENEDLKINYNQLKDEVVMLRKYIESSALPKCTVERGTVTDGDGVKSLMNNENGGSWKSDDERLKVNQVVNDLKKRKNVNFSQSNLEDIQICMEVDHNQNRSVPVESRIEIDNANVQQLKEENERLKTFARQQSELIERMSRAACPPVATPSAPPSAPPARSWPQSIVNQCPDELGVPSQTLHLGDALPFIGVVGNRHRDENRRLSYPWRGLSRPRGTDIPYPPNTSTIITNSTDSSSNRQTDGTSQSNVCKKSPIFKLASPDNKKIREKSSKTVLREAKQELRVKALFSSAVRDKSSEATVREAKRRLRKLEIEAEAVEKSYLDYRLRKTKPSSENTNAITTDGVFVDHPKKIGIKQSKSPQKLDENPYRNDNFIYKESPGIIKKDFDKYFKEYQKTNVGKSDIINVYSVIEKVKPIPESYSNLNENKTRNYNINYLETPLMEFRKLYQTQKSNIRSNDKNLNYYNHPNTENDRNKHEIIQLAEKANSDVQPVLIIQDQNGDINIDTNEGNLLSANERVNKKYDTENKNLEENFDTNQPKQQLYQTELNMEDAKDHVSKENGSNLSVEINNLKPETDANNKITDEINNEMNDHKSKEKVEEKLNEAVEIVKQKSNKEVEHEEIKKDMKNLLMVEVENVCATTNIGVTESNKDLLVVVESSVDSRELVLSEIDNDKISTQMTILVCPKKEVGDNTNIPTEIAKLAENEALSSIYHADANLISSVDMPLDSNKIEFIGDIEKDVQDYPDDFSADVDNYNSQSDYGKNSPISLPKTSEDDSFWDL